MSRKITFRAVLNIYIFLFLIHKYWVTNGNNRDVKTIEF